MPYAYNVYAGTIGLQFVITVKDQFTGSVKDLSSSRSIQIIFTKPDRTTYTVVGNLYTDGTDGKISYVSTSSDLTIAGIWYLQATYLVGLSQFYSQISNFTVLENLNQYNL